MILGVDEMDQLYSISCELGKRIISREVGNADVTAIAQQADGRAVTGHENGLLKIWNNENSLEINIFDSIIDNIFYINRWKNINTSMREWNYMDENE
jgi:hypothetical protein